LKNSDPNVRSGAIGALIRMRDQASAPAIVDVIRQDKETAPRLTALAGLPTMNGSAVSAMYVDAVIGVLSDPSSEVRKEAVMALGQVGDRRALPEILRVSKTERDRTVRQAILYTIGKLATDADAPAVEAVLLDSLDSAPAESAVREAAVYGLGKVRNPRAERRLIAALNDADPNVQRAAAEALGDLGSARAIDPLINLLGTPDKPDKNDKYDKKLGKIGNERALRPLLLAVKDENPYVRAAAEAAVKRIGSQSGETDSLSELMRDPSPAVRAQVAGKLGVSKDPAALPLLIRLLGDPDYTVRRSAVAGLANFRDPASLEKIAAALDDDDLSTRQGAATVLGLAGNPQSVEALAAHARDSQGAVRAEIIRALGRIKDERSLPAIVSANQDPDPPVRLAVAEALASFSTPAARAALEALARDSVAAVRDAALASLKSLPPSPPAPPRIPRRSR
jgi:HEAT repeat protein